MDVLCSSCNLIIIAQIPDEQEPPADGLGLCGPCGETRNSERVAEASALIASQITKYTTLASLLGTSLPNPLPTDPSEKLSVLKAAVGL